MGPPKHTCLDVAIAAGLRLAKVAGKEYQYHCPGPGHGDGDSSPSLEINPDKDGFHCFPCNASGGPASLVALIAGFSPDDKKSIGKWFKDNMTISGNGNGVCHYATAKPPLVPAAKPETALRPESPTVQKKPTDAVKEEGLPKACFIDGQHHPVLKWYRYTDQMFIARIQRPGNDPETGKPKKTFRPWGFGHWITRDKPLPPGEEWPLFGADQLLETSRVLILEGEECVFTARSAPEACLYSVTAAGCAKGEKHLARYAKALPETVTEAWISCDNDPSGVTQGKAWEKALQEHSRVKKIRFSRALPGVGVKGDICDFAKAHGDGWPLAFLTYFGGIVPWIRPEPETPQHKRYITASNALDNNRTIEWLVKGLIPNPGLVIWHAPGSHKKTFAAMDLSVCVSAGFQEWLGHPIIQCPSLWVDHEGGDVRTMIRMADAIRGNNAGPDVPIYALSFVGFNFKGDMEESIKRLKESIVDTGARLVTIDSLCATTPGAEENSAKEMGPILQRFRDLILQELKGQKVSILFIHHDNKLGGFRGSSTLRDFSDAMLQIDSPHGSDTIKFKHEKLRDAGSDNFSAKIQFTPGMVCLSRTEIRENRSTPTEKWITRFLASRPNRSATMKEIQNAAKEDSPTTPSTAKKVVHEMKDSGLIRNIGSGPGGAGVGIYQLVSTLYEPESNK